MELTKDQIRRPDAVTAELKKGFEWTTQHSRLVGTLLAVVLLGAIGWATLNYLSNSKEDSWQEKYYLAEKAYLEKKEKFDLFETTANAPVDPKTKQAPPAQGEKRTGDLNQDFGTSLSGFEQIIKEAPKSKAAAQSALTLAEVYRSYQKAPEAIEVLKQTQNVGGTLGALVAMELGSLQADTGQCADAVNTWNQALKDKASAFVAPLMKVRLGLCSESLGKPTEAQEFYKQAMNEGGKDSAAAKNAEKYLRILQTSTGTTN